MPPIKPYRHQFYHKVAEIRSRSTHAVLKIYKSDLAINQYAPEEYPLGWQNDDLFSIIIMKILLDTEQIPPCFVKVALCIRILLPPDIEIYFFKCC